jgi:hypothetical protein
MTNHEGHKKLWGELAKTGSGDKVGMFYKLFPDIEDSADNRCFACMEVVEKRNLGEGMGIDSDYCKYCPIDWGVKQKFATTICFTSGSPFQKWDDASTTKTRKKYAAIIRDLPWKSVKKVKAKPCSKTE